MASSAVVGAVEIGAVSSLSPCLAPRLLVATTLAHGDGGVRVRQTIAFIAGCCTGYVLLGCVAGLIGWIAAVSTYALGLCGAAAIAAGVWTIARTNDCCTTNAGNVAHGLSFGAGLGCTALATPCCAPALSFVLLGAGASGSQSPAVVLGFVLGQAAAFALAMCSFDYVRRLLAGHGAQTAIATVAGALMMALGAYYFVLA